MGGAGETSRKPPPPAAREEDLKADNALHALGFEFTRITAREVAGRLAVTETCCQPFKMLNGGVSALMAESTASIGAYMASGYRRVAGVQLSINHLRPARLGDVVQAKATPVQLGRNIQVWEVQVWRVDPSTLECKDLVSTARVTVLVNLQISNESPGYVWPVRKLALVLVFFPNLLIVSIFLSFCSWLVKSLISKKESFSEDRVPGTSSATVFANLFTTNSNFLIALCAENDKMISDREKVITAARTTRSMASPVSASLRTAPAASRGGDCAATRRGCSRSRVVAPQATAREDFEAHVGRR